MTKCVRRYAARVELGSDNAPLKRSAHLFNMPALRALAREHPTIRVLRHLPFLRQYVGQFGGERLISPSAALSLHANAAAVGVESIEPAG